MHDSLNKAKATPASLLDGSSAFSEKDPIRSIQAKEPTNAFLKQTGTAFAPRQAGRDWWWCDDV
jgi:hypothetical protein